MTLDDFCNDAIEQVLEFRKEVKANPQTYDEEMDQDKWIEHLLTYIGFELE